MDLFTDDEVPFGVSSLFSCPKDTEHLERAFDFLRYQHMSGELGVPSVVNQDTTLVRPLLDLGNTSGSAEFGFDSSSAQGGPQKINGGGKYGASRLSVMEFQRLIHALQAFLLFLATRNLTENPSLAGLVSARPLSLQLS